MLRSQTTLDRTLIYLLLILALAALLRIIFLPSIPNTFHCDEATRGYDAYSILKTLRDRYGEFLPLQSFGTNF
jgi:hypothetical protein